MRTFFGGTFLKKEELEEVEIRHSIKYEYYKQINEDDINCYGKERYGIHIVKTEYKPDNINIETKEIKYLTNDEVEVDRILNIFKENKVTLINSEEVIYDYFQNKYCKKLAKYEKLV